MLKQKIVDGVKQVINSELTKKVVAVSLTTAVYITTAFVTTAILENAFGPKDEPVLIEATTTETESTEIVQ